MVDVEDPGGDGIFGLDTPLDEAGVIVVPAPFEATVSCGAGTARAPDAVLAASNEIDLFDLETGRPYEAGIVMTAAPDDVAAWNRAGRAAAQRVHELSSAPDDPSAPPLIAEADACCHRLNAWVEGEVSAHLDRGLLVGVLGGDHSVAFGSIAAHAARFPGMGVLHIDAHADLREAYAGLRWSHASVLFNARRALELGPVVGVGYRDLCATEHRRLESDPSLHPYYDPWLRSRLQEGTPWAELAAQAVSHLPHDVYVTFDIDGLDPSLCPGTGTPVPGGLSFAEATSLLKAVAQSGRRIVGFDLCEVGSGLWDANVGARVLYKLIGFALLSREGR